MNTLGVSAFGDGAGAALVSDGLVVAAAEEERFSRRRRDARLPLRSARFCLARGGISPTDLDHLVFYEKPLRRFERVLASQLRAFPRSGRTFAKSAFHWLGDRLWLKNQLAEEFGVPSSRVLFCEHHLSHAASAYLASPFSEAAILVADGAGEWTTTSLAHGEGSKIEMLAEIDFPSSLGLFAGALTQYLGFEPGADESKIAALSAFGEPRFEAELGELLGRAEGGGFALSMEPFRFDFDDERRFGSGLERRLGPARLPTSPLRSDGEDRRDADVAASLQCVLERALLDLARELHRRVPSENLCLAGELALNVSANARLLREGPFERLFVAPAPGDAGAALGAALYVDHALGARSRGFEPLQAFVGEDVLAQPGPDARRIEDEEARIDELVNRLARGQTVGWVRGRFEWGPRSLGHRSLLADPGAPGMKAKILRTVKRREEFIPFAPAVSAERADEYFEVPSGAEWPARFMQISLRAKSIAHEHAPAALHVDGTARAQIVHEREDPLFHQLLTRFGEATGRPLLLNTSLNLRGDPIARGEADALAVFERSALDALLVEDRLYARA